MRQSIAANDRAEMVKRVVREYKDLVLRANTQKIQINAGDTGLSLTAILMFSQAARSDAAQYVDDRRLAAIDRLVDEHCEEIRRARSIGIDFGFSDGAVTYDSNQVLRSKGSAAA